MGRKLGEGEVRLVEVLVNALDRLAAEADCDSKDVICASPIPGFGWARLGVNGEAVMLLLPPNDGTEIPRQDLEHITIIPRLRYDVSVDGDTREETVALISTKGRDAWLIETFLELTAMLLQAGSAGDEKTVQQFIQDLVVLFRALTQPPSKTLQGLWGELFLIASSSNAELMVRAWHPTPNDRYDFTLANERVEVKTTTGPRIHNFNHQQLNPATGLRVAIASFVLEPMSTGLSCSDLTTAISDQISDGDLRRMFIGQVIKTLGKGWQHQPGVRFNPDHAASSLRFFDVRDIPSISCPIPPEISGVSYRCDLQAVREFSIGEDQVAGPLIMSATQTG